MSTPYEQAALYARSAAVHEWCYGSRPSIEDDAVAAAAMAGLDAALPHLLAPIEALLSRLATAPVITIDGVTQRKSIRPKDLRAALASIKGQG